MNKLLAWSRLMRLSNLPTAWSNILMGLVVSLGQWEIFPVLLLLTVSTCMYLGGMILNDVCDVERDRIERPNRVLPGGEISTRMASRVAYVLLALGPIIAALSTLEWGNAGVLKIGKPTAGIALVLGVTIMAYNFGGKDSVFGPILMGFCRFLNVLLGTSQGEWNSAFPGPDGLNWYIAGCIGLFVSGITLFAKSEQGTSPRRRLVFGALLMLVALGAILYLPFTNYLMINDLHREINTPVRVRYAFCGMIVIMLIPACRKVTLAIYEPGSFNVQRGVIACLQALIMIDAAVCFLFSFTVPAYAIVVALLVIPRAILGRFIAST